MVFGALGLPLKPFASTKTNAMTATNPRSISSRTSLEDDERAIRVSEERTGFVGISLLGGGSFWSGKTFWGGAGVTTRTDDSAGDRFWTGLDEGAGDTLTGLDLMDAFFSNAFLDAIPASWDIDG